MKLPTMLRLYCVVALLVSLSLAKEINVEDDRCVPNQVHLSLGDAYYNTLYNDQTKNPYQNNTNTSMFIVWQTKGVCDDNVLYVTKNGSTLDNSTKIFPSTKVWHQAINETTPAEAKLNASEGRYVSYSHTASLFDLKDGEVYNYEIYQNGIRKAGPFQFKVPSLKPNNKTLKFSIYGDIDTIRTNVTVDALNNIAKKNPFELDMQLFLGDLGYEIYSQNGLRGEYFFNTMQPSFGSTPFMITPGNHEIYNNYTFLNFRNRMPLYNQTYNKFYSYSVGNAHFIGIDIYAWDDELTQSGKERIQQWVEDDLIMANKNRASRPWIFVYTHQPIYCSLSIPTDREHKKCYNLAGKNMVWSDLFDKYKVDMVLQAHVHYYERMMPIAKNTSQKFDSWNETTRRNHMINPQAPIYTIEGSAGNSHYMNTESSPQANFSIINDTNFGFSTIKILNDSALYYEHLNSETGEVIDYLYLYKGQNYLNNRIISSEFPYKLLFWLILGVFAAAFAAWSAIAFYRKYSIKKDTESTALLINDKGTGYERPSEILVF